MSYAISIQHLSLKSPKQPDLQNHPIAKKFTILLQYHLICKMVLQQYCIITISFYLSNAFSLSSLSHFISLSLSNFSLLCSALSSLKLKPMQSQHFLPLYLRSICYGFRWVYYGFRWGCYGFVGFCVDMGMRVMVDLGMVVAGYCVNDGGWVFCGGGGGFC